MQNQAHTKTKHTPDCYQSAQQQRKRGSRAGGGAHTSSRFCTFVVDSSATAPEVLTTKTEHATRNRYGKKIQATATHVRSRMGEIAPRSNCLVGALSCYFSSGIIPLFLKENQKNQKRNLPRKRGWATSFLPQLVRCVCSTKALKSGQDHPYPFATPRRLPVLFFACESDPP